MGVIEGFKLSKSLIEEIHGKNIYVLEKNKKVFFNILVSH